MVGKAERVSSWILRTFHTRDKLPMVTLMKSLLIPTLEYGCVLWNPNQSKLRVMIENVLSKFTSRVEMFNEIDEETGLMRCTTDYWQRLKELKTYSLERRRERYLILFMYKIITKIYPNPGFDLSNLYLNDRLGVRMAPKADLKAPQWVERLRTAYLYSQKARDSWRLCYHI